MPASPRPAAVPLPRDWGCSQLPLRGRIQRGAGVSLGAGSSSLPSTMPRWHPMGRSQAAPHLCASCLPPHSHFSAPPSIAQRLCGQHTPVSPSVVWPAASFSTRAPANTDLGWGGAEGSLHHHQCVCVFARGGPLRRTKAQAVLSELAAAGGVEAPFHQRVLGPNRCLFECVHSASHLLSPG